MKTILLLATATLALTGCATVPVDPNLAADANRPIYCTAGADCEAKWSRAVTWIVRNSTTRIQVQTDTLVQTYTPESTAHIAYTATKLAVGGGRYEIVLEATCRNWIGCFPEPSVARASFARFVDPR